MTQALMQEITDIARRTRSLADSRVIIGQVAEEVAALRLGAQRQTTDGRKSYCMDLMRDRVAYEVKAVGGSRNVILYSARLIKDRHYAETKPLVYVFVVHTCRATLDSMAEVRRVMQYARIYALPFCYVDGIAATAKWRLMNRYYTEGHGGCRGGYERGGYLIPFARFEPFAVRILPSEEVLPFPSC